ncbi:MAG: hypothetical protein NZM12_08155 [Steroidobacteraceae bacterium]|nr:hypothetical protein [Steroidobacteraceae bacterium]MDW8258173.1 hypothetical protein [Gammaproteobacteria bacterium]
MIAGRTRVRSRTVAVALVALYCTATVVAAEPELQRIRIATVTTPDLGRFVQEYRSALGYRLREEGRVPRGLARSWGAPRVANARYVLLSSHGSPDVFIRGIEAPAARDYRPLTTFGWNAIELIVQNPDEQHAAMRDGPFSVIGEPKFLTGYPTIRAFQVEGFSGEVLYLTADTAADRSRSSLPIARSPVDRIFIMVVAGPDIRALTEWYRSAFALQPGPIREFPIGVLTRAQRLSSDRLLPLTTARLAQHGNLLEFDGYSENATARSVRRGYLPPGVAIATFSVRDLERLPLQFLAAPLRLSSAGYEGRRAATARGPVGELIEFIEERP